RGQKPQQRLEGRQLAGGGNGEAPVAVALDVAQRAERLGRAQLLAAADVHLGVAAMRGDELERRGGLADAGLAFERDDASGAGACGAEGGLQACPGLFALE